MTILLLSYLWIEENFSNSCVALLDVQFFPVKDEKLRQFNYFTIKKEITYNIIRKRKDVFRHVKESNYFGYCHFENTVGI